MIYFYQKEEGGVPWGSGVSVPLGTLSRAACLFAQGCFLKGDAGTSHLGESQGKTLVSLFRPLRPV